MKKIFIALMALIALASCNNNEFDTPANTTGEIKLVLTADGFNQHNPRSVVEGQIDDITILEFQENILVKRLYYHSQDFLTQALTIADGELLPIAATTMKKTTNIYGNEIEVLDETAPVNLIYVVTNLGSEDATGLTVGSSTFQDFQNKSLDFDKTKEVVPMSGYYYGGIAVDVTDQINVTLVRNVAKINFTLNTTNFKVGTEIPNTVVNSIKLINVPKKFYPYPSFNRPVLPKDNLAGVWPNGAIQNHIPEVPAIAEYTTVFEDYGVEQNNTTGDVTKSYVAYIPENLRGSWDDKITNQRAKHPGSILGTNDWYTDATDGYKHGYTYILVDLDYVLKNGITKNATYKIFLGGDNKGDMNLLRNVQYNITTYLYGADTNDLDNRIDVSPIFDPATGLQGAETANLKENANCYIINHVKGTPTSFVIPFTQVRMGWNTINSKLANGETVVDIDRIIQEQDGNSWEMVTLWKTWKGNPITFDKTSGISFGSGYGTKNEDKYFVKVTIPSDLDLSEIGHNAVIALKNTTDGKIYWSWHLWLTDYNPDKDQPVAGQVHTYYGNAFKTAGLYEGKVMMDRNLGATITGVTGAINQPATNTEAAKYFGLLYQYGRKDPFIGADGTAANSAAKIYDSSDQEMTFSPQEGPKSLAVATNTPEIFYYTSTGSWNSININPWNEKGTKSIFDPCPPGWRVPAVNNTNAAYNVWAGFGIADGSSIASQNNGTTFKWLNKQSEQDYTVGRMYEYDNPQVQAWYPASGFRAYNAGTIAAVGSGGYFWGATSGYSFTFHSGTANPANNNVGSYGFSIRCVQE